MLKLLIAAYAALLLLPPAAALAQDAAPASISRLSLDLAQKWTDAYETGDAGMLAAVYAEDATISMAGVAPSAGRAAIEKMWAEDIAQESASLTLLTVTSETIAEGRQEIAGDYLVVDRATGRVIATGAFAQSWELQADGETWLIAMDDWQGAKIQPIPLPGDAPRPEPTA